MIYSGPRRLMTETAKVTPQKLSFDKTLTPPTDPYKINGKMKIKNPRTINGTRFKFVNKFSLAETFKMADALD